MVYVKNLIFEFVRFRCQVPQLECFDSDVEKFKMNFAAEKLKMIVVVAYTNFGTACAFKVVHNLVEVL